MIIVKNAVHEQYTPISDSKTWDLEHYFGVPVYISKEKNFSPAAKCIINVLNRTQIKVAAQYWGIGTNFFL